LRSELHLIGFWRDRREAVFLFVRSFPECPVLTRFGHWGDAAFELGAYKVINFDQTRSVDTIMLQVAGVAP